MFDFLLSSVLRGCLQLYACLGFSRLSVKTSISDLTRVFFSEMKTVEEVATKMQHVQRCERSIMLRIGCLILFQQAL